jgi:hypothetical protein
VTPQEHAEIYEQGAALNAEAVRLLTELNAEVT